MSSPGRSVVVVGPPAAASLARIVAGTLARVTRSPSLLITHGARPARAWLPPLPAAYRAAGLLRSQGHAVRASGLVVDVELEGDVAAARMVALRTHWGEGPVVVVLCGAREPWADAVLEKSDLVVVAMPAGGPAGLAPAAVLGLGQFARAVRAITFDATPSSCWRGRRTLVSEVLGGV